MKERIIQTLRAYDPGLRGVIDQAYRETGLDKYELEQRQLRKEES